MNEFIEFLKYVIIGLVQGVTEPLPISSSGHMLIFDSIFGVVIPATSMNNFQIITNFASLIAIVIYYRLLIKKLAIGSWKYLFNGVKEEKSSFTYVMLLLLASIPAGIVGIIIKIYEIDAIYTNILCAGICLFITGILLLYIHHNAKDATRETITWKDSLLMGTAQVFALLPGISRSGITTSIAIKNKVSLHAALRFSFMMYIPASLGAAVIGFYDIFKTDNAHTGSLSGYIGAFIASLIGTYFAVNIFFKLVKNQNLKYFGYYCITVSFIVLFLIAAGVFIW